MRVEWTDLAAGAVGESIDLPRFGQKTVSMRTDTPGTSNVLFAGFNLGSSEVVSLHEPDGTLIATASEGLFFVEENPSFVLPVALAGTGGPFDIVLEVATGLG